MSASARDAEKPKLMKPCVSTVIDGTIRRELKMRSRSFALKTMEATSSWIDFASLAASRSFVGVVMRSTSTTRKPSPIRPLSAVLTSDDLP